MMMGVLGFPERSYTHVQFYRDYIYYIYQKSLIFSFKNLKDLIL
jgi:hypothetical protein